MNHPDPSHNDLLAEIRRLETENSGLRFSSFLMQKQISSKSLTPDAEADIGDSVMPQAETVKEFLLSEIFRLKVQSLELKGKNDAIKKEKEDFEILVSTNVEHSDFITEELFAEVENTKRELLERIEKLREESAFQKQKIAELKREEADLEALISTDLEHSDYIIEDLISKLEKTKQYLPPEEAEILYKEIAHQQQKISDLEMMIATNIVHSDFVTEELISTLEKTKRSLMEKIENLRLELDGLRQKLAELEAEKADLEMMIQMNAEHSDQLEEDLLNKADAALRESEQRFRLISETIPIPIIVTLLSDSSILYANKPAASLFGVCVEKLLKRTAAEFFDPEYRRHFVQSMSEGLLRNYEMKGRKYDGSSFWGEVFIQPLIFNDRQCLITALYDTTERRKAEEEIRRLNQELAEREKENEGKYLTFVLDGEEYGIHIARVKSIIPIMPLTPVPHTPEYMKGVINLRGKVVPIADLRRKFGLKAAEHTAQTCILITEIFWDEAEKGRYGKCELVGFIADSVSEVVNVRGRDIHEVTTFGKDIRADYVLGFTVVRGKTILLIRIDKIIRPEDMKS